MIEHILFQKRYGMPDRSLHGCWQSSARRAQKRQAVNAIFREAHYFQRHLAAQRKPARANLAGAASSKASDMSRRVEPRVMSATITLTCLLRPSS